MMTILNILGMQDDPHGKGICSLWEAFTNLFAVDTPHYHTAISWLLYTAQPEGQKVHYA